MYKRKNIKHFTYKTVQDGWIVVNRKTDAHAHFANEQGCIDIIHLLLKKEFPENEYLQESYRRLEDKKEKKIRKKHRTAYINRQKGGTA